MQRRRALMMGEKKARLPGEYQEVEWIQTVRDKTRFIFPVTELPPIFEVKMCNTTNESWAGVMFYRGGSYLTIERKNAQEPYYQLTSLPSGRTLLSNINVQTKSILRVDNGTFTVNGENVGTIEVDSFLPTHLYLCGSYGTSRQTRLWYYIDAGRHLVPCYKKSDGTKGLYDIVNKEFNSGAGDQQYFTIGPEVN